jgi:hypothetical protein
MCDAPPSLRGAPEIAAGRALARTATALQMLELVGGGGKTGLGAASAVRLSNESSQELVSFGSSRLARRALNCVNRFRRT